MVLCKLQDDPNMDCKNTIRLLRCTKVGRTGVVSGISGKG